MADANIDITAGSGTSIDTRTEGTNGHHRQVVVLGDPATNAGVAPVDATAGVKVNLGADNDVTVTNATAANLKVDGSDVTQPVSGTVTANLSATDNTVLDNIDTNTNYGQVTGGGVEATALRVTLANDSTGLVSVDDGGSSLTVDGTVTASNTAGDVAADAVDSGNPVKVGGKAKAFDGTAPGTDVAEDDRTNFIATVEGRQFVETAHPNYWSASADYAAAQTNTTVKAAPGAGLKLYITDIILSNGATAGNITLLDGSGGTVLFELYPAVNGGAVVNLRTPIALTANTLLAITSTTVTTHSITVSGFIAA